MDTKRKLAWARYIGIGVAVLVPALVVAQQQQRNPPADGTFQANSLLRAGDVESLRDALADAISRINQLEARSVNKGRVYPVDGIVTINPGQSVNISASCADDSDLLLDCGCRGTQGENGTGANSQTMDVRRITTTNAVGALSVCTCTAQHAGSVAGSSLIATATCLTVP